METKEILTVINSVVQVNELGPQPFVGCFVLVTEVRNYGVQGFPPVPGADGRAYVNLEWHQFDYIGQATMVPDEKQKT